MPELLTYTVADFNDLSVLMQELSGSIVFTRESLERMLADPNSHLYVIREAARMNVDCIHGNETKCHVKSRSLR